MIASDARLVTAEGLFCIAWILVVDKSVASLESQFVDVAKLSEFIHEIFASYVPRELADVQLRLPRSGVVSW